MVLGISPFVMALKSLEFYEQNWKFAEKGMQKLQHSQLESPVNRQFSPRKHNLLTYLLAKHW